MEMRSFPLRARYFPSALHRKSDAAPSVAKYNNRKISNGATKLLVEYEPAMIKPQEGFHSGVKE